ncbi:MAG: hypothetical protein KDI15_07625 [Thiothrix sp.]|nr:hypothetical protein [Thiothrix sp.]HPE62408.1 hypothetical protein [Thiolinea sp.]
MERPTRSRPEPEQTGVATREELSAEHRVEAAKQRLRAMSEQVDYLGPIRQHPLAFTGTAFVTGLLWQRLSRHKLTPGMLALAVQLFKKL